MAGGEAALSRRACTAVYILFFVLLACAFSVLCAPAARADDYDSWRQEIFDLVNKERESRGVAKLEYYDALEVPAQVRAEEAARKFSHTRPSGEAWKSVFSEYGFESDYRGENLAYGQKSAQQVMDAWMKSKGHRANILDERFTHMAVGIYDKSGKLYYSQLFLEADESMIRTGVAASLTPAEIGKEQEVAGSSLTLFNAPERTSSLAAVLQKGDPLTVENVDMGSGWAQVRTGATTGYAGTLTYEGALYLDAPPGLSLSEGTNALEALAPAQAGGEAVVTGANLNLRAQPDKAAESVGVTYEGETVSVVSVEAGWAYVRLSDGREGYVSAYYLRVNAQ